MIEGWARDGLTDKQIAENIGVNEATLNRWKKSHMSIMQALKKGKEVVDRQVENALFKTATGFYYDEETVTNQGEVVTVRKYSKPSTTAQIYWLKNRKRDVWTDKQEVQLEANVTTNKLDGILAQLEDDSS